MRTMKLRSAAALIAAAFLLTGVTGCGRSGSRQGGLTLSLDHAYSSEKLSVEGSVQSRSVIEFDGRYLLQGMDEFYNPTYCLYDLSDGSVQPVELQYLSTLEEGCQADANTFFVDAQGHLNVVYSGYAWRTNEDGEEYGEAMPYVIEIYDKDMNVLETTELDLGLEEDATMNQIAANPVGGYLVSIVDPAGNQTLALYDTAFRQTGVIDGAFQRVSAILPSANGSVFLWYENGDYEPRFAKIDPRTGKMTPLTIEGIPRWFNNCLPSNDPQYDFYVYDTTALYGINGAKGTCSEVVNWLNSDFMGNSVTSIGATSDGRFILTSTTMKEDAASELWILTERDPDAFRNVTMISMAALSLPDELAEAVLQFNRTHDDARIAVASYDKYNTEADGMAGLKRLQTDMTSGIVADLICTTGLPYESLANKGIFEDLSGYMKDYTQEDYFTNLFDTMKYGDKLYHLGFSYDLQTLVGKKDVIGDKQGLTKTEFIELAKSLPPDMALLEEATKRSVMDVFITGDIKSYTDVAEGEAHFDSPDFAATLEFCNQFPNEAENGSSLEGTELTKFFDDKQYQYLNNKTAICTSYYSGIKSAYQTEFINFGDAELNRIGFPVNNENSGNGGRFMVYNTVAMSSNSSVKEQCWEFMRYMFSDEYQDGLSWSLPIKKSSFDKLVAEAMKPMTYMDEDGTIQEVQETVYRGNEEIEIPTMPQSYADELKAYIENVHVCSYYDVQIYQIINEETQMFFSGDQNAQHTAEMIQSRVSIYLAEQS